jgi:hypothetical protein
MYLEPDESGTTLTDADGMPIAVTSADFNTKLGGTIRDDNDVPLQINPTESYGELHAEGPEPDAIKFAHTRRAPPFPSLFAAYI